MTMTIRIPRNLRESTKQPPSYGYSFSALIRERLIEEPMKGR